MAIPPFVHINGQPFLVVNFDLGGEPINHKACLKALLHHHNPADILLLRPLSPAEGDLLHCACRDAGVETWAQVVVSEQDRFRPRE